MSALNQSTPRAEGDLAKTPFAHLLLYLHREALNGTLVVQRGGYETKVLFRNGRAVAARPIPRGAGLHEGLLELCGLAEASYAFWDGDLVGEADGSGEASGVIRGTVDPHSFVAESLRSYAREPMIASIVERYRGMHLRLMPEADLRRLGLRGVEARLVEQLRTVPRVTEDFVEHSEVSPAEARKLLYLLLITRYVHPLGSDSSSTSGVRSAVQSAPPSTRTPLPMRAPSATPGRGTPMPSQAPSPRPPGARHTDPAAAAEGEPSSSQVPGASGRSDSPTRSSLPAWQQLRPSGRPSPSSPSIPSPSLAPPPVEYLDPAGKLKRAEQLAGRRNFQDAERIVDDLIGSEPANADYHAMRAFLQLQQWTSERPPRSLVEAIERALRINEEQARALYVKGMVLQRIGKRNEAIRYFQKALDSDPRHLEAEREIRLARMRRDR